MDSSEATQEWTRRATRRRNVAIESTAAVIATETSVTAPAPILRWSTIFIGTLLVVLPLMFGGVHASVYAPAQIAVFILTPVLVWRFGQELRRRWRADSLCRTVLITGAFFLAYAAARLIVTVMLAPPHPIL